MGEGKLTKTVRRLRRDMTEAERKLWGRLRNRQLENTKFVKQFAIGPYVADFCSLERRIIIEIDGGQHARQTDADDRRSRWLGDRGFIVIRFWNNEVLQNPEGVLARISQACTTATGMAKPEAE